jgi:hypothetical protein
MLAGGRLTHFVQGCPPAKTPILRDVFEKFEILVAHWHDLSIMAAYIARQ